MVARIRKQLKWLRLGALLVPAGLALLWSYEIWQAEWRHAEEHAIRNAELASEYTLRLAQAQQILIDRAEALLHQHPTAAERPILVQKLGELRASAATTRSIVIIDDNGEPVASSPGLPLDMSFSDRPFFASLRADPNTFHIDRQILHPSGIDALLFARRTRAGGPSHIIVTTVDVPTLHGFYQRLAPERNMASSVTTRSGRLLIRNRPLPMATGLAADTEYMRAIQSRSEGVLRLTSSSDGVKRLYAYKQVGDLPLYANFGIAETSVRNAIVEELVPDLAVMFLVALLGYVAIQQVQQRLETQISLIHAQRSAELKDTLFKEMNHRIRNNLLAIQSLIALQARKSGQRQDMQDIEKRIWAISEVHNLLYSAGTTSTMDFGRFVQTLCGNPSIVPPESGIAVRCEIVPVQIDTRQAVPAALILLEMLTNAVKHAFPNGAGTITVRLEDAGDMAVAVVADDGIGLPAERTRSSGMQLIEGFARQIGATLEIEVAQGTRFTLVFPKAGEGMATATEEATPAAPPGQGLHVPPSSTLTPAH